MKTIIVPTDFSAAAINAVNYAADMGLQMNARLLLFHVYQLPLAITDTPIILMSVDELRETAEEKLNDLKQSVTRVTGGKITIDTEARMGMVADELEDVCRKVKPFLVIMGTTGHSAVERVVFGSTTLNVVHHLSWPVICVPTGKEYGAGIHKIGLAFDTREIMESTPIGIIKEFVTTFNGELHVLNISPNQVAEPQTSEQFIVLKKELDSLQAQHHFLEDNSVEEGVNKFADQNDLDLIITIPKKHKLLETLFRKSATSQLVFGGHVPVMCVHE